MLIQLARIHDDVATAKGQCKAVQTARRRTIDILAINVVMGAVAWALEAVAVVAEWHLAAQMYAYLVERQPVGIAVFDPILRLHGVGQRDARLEELRGAARLE